MAEKKPKKSGKKPASGEHKKKRRPMALPVEWDDLAQELAEAAGQPKMWYVCTLLKAAAEAKGRTSLPRPPWIKTDDGERPKKPAE